jgi:hypothetical protein
MKSLISQAGPYIKLAFVEVKHENLTASQKVIVKPDSLVVSITATSGAKIITSFEGTLAISIPYTGPLPANVWYLSDSGAPESVSGVYDTAMKAVSFKTKHLSLFVVAPELSAEAAARIRLTIGSLSYSVGGVPGMMDAPPRIIDGRTMVPLRFIAEAMGAKVDWDDETKTATIDLNGLTLRVSIGVRSPGMDVPAIILNDRTMVPLRYISETLGRDVLWNPDTQTIDIASG